MQRITLIAAVRDEESGIEAFLADFESLRRSQINLERQVQLILVEDGSSDLTNLRIIDSKNNNGVILLTVEKCFGQGWAMSLGIQYAMNSDFLVFMDADSSHPIETIPVIIELLEKGERVVQCKKLNSTNQMRDHLAKGFGLATELLFSIPFKNQNTFFRGMRLEDLLYLIQIRPSFWWFLRFSKSEWRRLNPFILGINQEQRIFGNSKYNFLRLLKFASTGFFATVELTPIVLAVVTSVSISYLFDQNLLRSNLLFFFASLLAVKLVRFQKLNKMEKHRVELLYRGPDTF